MDITKASYLVVFGPGSMFHSTQLLSFLQATSVAEKKLTGDPLMPESVPQ